MAVTIKDLAKETGLGSATISAYLNGIPVRPYNKVKIEAAIEKLGYIRNDYARGLKTHSSKTIGVLIPELSNIFATTIISKMEESLRDKGYGIIVCDCKTDVRREQEVVKFLLSKMVDGLIVMPIFTDGNFLQVAVSNGVPTVVIDRMTDRHDVSHIVINNRYVSRCAVERMIAKGAKKVAHIAGGKEVYTASERRKGYNDAVEKLGYDGDEMTYCGQLSVDGGYNATKEVLREHADTDAIFVSNYEMTVGSIIALKEAGRVIDEDIHFVGFDIVEMSKMFSPPLVTVQQPLEEIGRVAAETILDMINGEPCRNIVLEACIEE